MSKRLYVGNIPYTTTDPDIRDFFHPFTLTEVKICFDRETQRPRGFGFVELLTEEDAQKAREQLDGVQLGGRRVTVAVAEERKKADDNRNRRRGR